MSRNVVNNLHQYKGVVNIINDTVEAGSCVDIVTKFTDEEYTHNYKHKYALQLID